MEGIRIYLDDILIHNNSITRVRELTLEVLGILDKYDLYVKPKKCDWEQLEVEYLGMMVSESGIQMDKGKTNAIKEWPIPKNFRHLQKFIGFSHYIRRFL